ncbi:hypothetical protein BPOR_0273g00200 [Botrytis porri]|uniref:Uncharacterized protein n=1 Tax=Botrytis porri TaxID=87229 RepID=A0A4Z1KL96_9HELO|nr:hypothetical protein BPOR_0273g00200 [Botrytis porri]
MKWELLLRTMQKRYKTMRDIHGSILKLETQLKARTETNKTKSPTHEVAPVGDISEEEFLKNLSHADFVEGLMRLAKKSSAPKIDSYS